MWVAWAYYYGEDILIYLDIDREKYIHTNGYELKKSSLLKEGKIKRFTYLKR